MSFDWAAVTDLFHRALEQPADRRAAWLDEACAGDPALREELLALLAAHEALPPDTSTEGAIGRSIGPYTLIRAIGAGGMGIVYLAEDTRLGRRVALKALAPDWAHDPIRRERLRREARAAGALSHPGIATIFALEEIDGALYLASEFVPGETIRDELSGTPLPAARVIDTGIALADALGAAHAQGIIHRDVKPENIVRATDGRLKILDFGLAYDMDASAGPNTPSRLTRDGAVLGTPAYMAPEQIRHTAVDARTDLFALGVVLYELATGTHPFADGSPAATISRVLEHDPAPVPGPLGRVIARCLAKTPDDRFPSANALRTALEDLREGRAKGALERTVVTDEVAPSPVRHWWEFHQAATSLTYVALLWPIRFATDAVGAPYGLVLFLTAMASVLAATSLRLHLWFTLRWYPAERLRQQRRSGPWIRAAGILFVTAMFVTVGATLTAHTRIAVLLVAASVAVLVSFTVIEPATRRAAFHDA